MKVRAGSEGMGRIEELEETKRKLQTKVSELEQELEQTKAKFSASDKAKQRLQVWFRSYRRSSLEVFSDRTTQSPLLVTFQMECGYFTAIFSKL